MGILKSAADVVYTIRFLRLLVTPFEETDAYKAGIINADGSLNKEFNRNSTDDREAYRRHYTTFHRLVFNLKRIMAKAPGGQSVVARYGAALALIKEHGELSDSQLEKIHAKTGIDILDCLNEQSQWFLLDDDQMAPGIYRMNHPTLTVEGWPLVMKGDKIRIHEEQSHPCHEVFGLKVYQATHLNSQRMLYITTSEITR